MRAFLFRFFLFLFLPGLLFTAPALSFPSPALAAQKTSLERLTDNFNSLAKNETRAKRRDLWQELENGFAAQMRSQKGENKARAAYYHARVRQEMGARSFLASDHREAAKRFGAVADAHARYAVARQSLYQQGLILQERLRDHAGAARALERLIQSYPNSNEARQAKKLLAEAKKNAAGAPAAASAPATVSKPAAGKAPTASQKASDAATRDRQEKKANASTVTLKNISWKGKPQRAVITLEMDAKADYTYNFLPPDAARNTPGRLYFDIAGAFPGDGVKAGIRPEDLVVSRIRTGRSGDGTRVTLECDGLACYAVRSPEGRPEHIEIEVSRRQDITDGTIVGEAAKAAAGQEKQVEAAPKKPASIAEQLGLTVETILLDPGHGGKDPGAQANGITEKNFTLAMAKRIGALLEKKGFRVLYTRTGNRYISLQDRPDLANTKKADLFISIHINANTTPGVHGLETYYLDEAKTQNAAVVAARENAVSVKNISDLQFILTDLMLGSKVKESHRLAECVQSGILKRLRAAQLSMTSNGVRSGPFYVLMGARMPAILVEFGYITNKGDAASLKSERFLQRQAEGVVDGIMLYKTEVEKLAPR